METTSTASPVTAKTVLPPGDKSLPAVQSLAANISSDPSKSGNDHQVLSDFFNSLINKDPSRGASSKKPDLNSLRTATTSSSSQARPTSSTTSADFAKQLEQLKNAKSTKQ